MWISLRGGSDRSISRCRTFHECAMGLSRLLIKGKFDSANSTKSRITCARARGLGPADPTSLLNRRRRGRRRRRTSDVRRSQRIASRGSKFPLVKVTHDIGTSLAKTSDKRRRVYSPPRPCSSPLNLPGISHLHASHLRITNYRRTCRTWPISACSYLLYPSLLLPPPVPSPSVFPPPPRSLLLFLPSLYLINKLVQA